MSPAQQPVAYRTVHAYGEETIFIKKSRFIGYAMPISSEEEAVLFIDKIRKQHWDATHNCYAYVAGPHDDVQKSNDDGEPSGTAGKPILEVIKKEQIKDVVVVVTRYFGGILLGAGGLIRAYSQTAAAALHAAKIVRQELYQAITIDLDYSWHGKVEHLVAACATWIVADTQFTDHVQMLVQIPIEDVERFTKQLANGTNGQAVIQLQDTLYVGVPVEP